MGKDKATHWILGWHSLPAYSGYYNHHGTKDTTTGCLWIPATSLATKLLRPR